MSRTGGREDAAWGGAEQAGFGTVIVPENAPARCQATGKITAFWEVRLEFAIFGFAYSASWRGRQRPGDVAENSLQPHGGAA